MTITPKVAKPTAAQEREAYELVTLRDWDTCQRCRRDCGWGVTSRDHRKGRGVGGLTTVTNLQVLGGTGVSGCHGWKTANPAAAMAEGWSVPSWADPAEWPARRWLSTGNGVLRLAWVLYTTDGRWVELSEQGAKRRMERSD